MNKMRWMVLCAALMLGGIAFGQIMPGGNKPPKNTVSVSGGGDAFLCGKITVIDPKGQPSSLDGLHRIFAKTGAVETFVIIINPDGTKSSRWVQAADAVR